MVKRYIIPGILLLAVIAAIIAVFPTNTRRVKRRVHDLAKWVSKVPDESNMVMVAKLNNIKGALAEDCRLHAPTEDVSDTYGRQDVVRMIAGARAQFEQVDITVTDLHVTFAQKKSAAATFTGTITGLDSGGSVFREIREIVCTLQKIDNAWLLTEAEIVEVLQK